MTLPIPINALAGSLAVNAYTTYPATSVYPDCRDISFEPLIDARAYGPTSSTSGYKRRAGIVYDTRLSFSIYPHDEDEGLLIPAHGLSLWGAETGGELAELLDATMLNFDITADNGAYVSSSTENFRRRVPGPVDFSITVEHLNQAGVLIGSPAWLEEGTYVDIEVRRGTDAVGLSATGLVTSHGGRITIDSKELIALTARIDGDGVIDLTGELGFPHIPGEYISVLGKSNTTKGIKGIFIIDRLSGVINLKEGQLVELTVDCSGDGTPGIEPVAL